VNFIRDGSYRVTVFTLDGKALSSEMITGQSAQMDVTNYVQSIYLISVEDGKQKTTVKIIKAQ
jgi:hypothetical protein